MDRFQYLAKSKGDSAQGHSNMNRIQDMKAMSAKHAGYKIENRDCLGLTS